MRIRQILLSVLVTLGLFSALGWTGTALACPSNAQAVPNARMNGCGHLPMPVKPQPDNHPNPICANFCFGVLPTRAQIELHPSTGFVPLLSRLASLVGTDPGIDPPPPRAV